MGETVTLITRTVTGRDADGNDVYSDVTSTASGGAVFAPGGSTEQLQGQDLVVSSPRFIWINVIPNLTAVDAIQRANGDKYEVTGTPEYYVHPRTGRQVLQVNVQKVTG